MLLSITSTIGRLFRIKPAQPLTFQRELLLILNFGIATFLFISLASFNPHDPSFFAYSFPKANVQNLCGSIGANFAAWSIHYGGCTAVLFPLAFLWLALLAYRDTDRKSLKLGLLGWCGLTFCLTLIINVAVAKVTIANLRFASGGIIGSFFGDLLRPLFGKVGLLIFSGTLAILCIYCILQVNLLAQIPTFKFRLPKFRFRKKSENVPVQPNFTRTAAMDIPIISGASAAPLIVDENEDETDIEQEASFFSRQAPRLKRSEALQTDYIFPPLNLFKTSQPTSAATSQQKKEFEHTAAQLTKTFLDFGVAGEVIAIQPGPVVTVFEFQPNAGTKLAKIIALTDDLALALKVDSIFIYPVRGKQAVGVQVPNTQRQMVRLGDILNASEFQGGGSPLTLALGKSIAGEPICADLSKMPHFLMAGATGAGKSVAINALLCSTIMKSSPRDVRMILVDPKMLELSIYEGIPHLLMPVITEPNKASLALKWAIEEMEKRYHLMQLAKVRHISALNEFWQRADEQELASISEQFGREINCPMPYILVVIDELADLMLQAPKDVETSIQRLAQKARASGIHLVLATQRPSVDIITGVIKANLPCRAAFQVVSKHDSRTILDSIGAEKLLGNGDMLFLRPGTSRVERIQGAFVSDEEVIQLVETVKQNAPVRYDQQLIDWIEDQAAKSQDGQDPLEDMEVDEQDPKYAQAIQIASRNGYISASYLQRQLKIGYNRAARMVELMEAKGLLAKANGVKPRRWLGSSESSTLSPSRLP